MINLMTSARATMAQATAQFHALQQRLRANIGEGRRLMSVTISAFMAGYVISTYLLVSRGLEYVQRLPILGPVLVERLLFLLFFFFFVMLIISNATITGMSLFRRHETGWLLSLPLPHGSIVLWKTLEGLFLSSWGLMLLSAPILGAFGKIFVAGPSFYIFSMAAVIALIAIAANISTWLLLLLLRFYKPWWWKVIAALVITAVVWLAVQIGRAQELRLTSGDVAKNVNQILQHTSLCVHPLLPSTWVADIAIASGKEKLTARAIFYLLVLISHALAVWPVTVSLANLWFFPSWNRTLRHSESSPAQNGSVKPISFKPSGLIRLATWLRIPRHLRALAAKDAITFVREPSQWGQCALIFGLLLIYTSNLRNLGYNYSDPLWSAIISYLNLTVCCLAMATLTTRFVFPQFSIEGRRFWIIGLTSFPLTQVLRQKFWLNLVAATPLTTLLVVISCVSLKLPLHRAIYFMASMATISAGLNAIALSLGALLPNFRESNTAKIVSGFGGTLCLIISFFYIISSIAILTIPAVAERALTLDQPSDKTQLLEIASYAGLVLLTLLAGGLPYYFAKKQTKKLAYLGYL